MIDPDFIPGSRFAVAFSGGGDSTALLHGLREHNPLVLIIDHALRDSSRAEAEQARNLADSLGLETRVLTWRHDSPVTGIQEKARKVRYGLMGEVCREEGIPYLLTGHTEDDQAETLLMRYNRNTDWRGAAGMAKAVHAPIWPELAGVTLARPLLDAGRRALRDYNHRHGLNWTEDPSNRNRNFTRIQARDYLNVNPGVRRHLLHTAQVLRAGLTGEKKRLRLFFEGHGRVDKAGLVHFDRVPPKQLLVKCLNAASGQGTAIDCAALSQLHGHMSLRDIPGRTLGGAHILKRRNDITIGRDPVAAKGRANKAAIPTQPLRAGNRLIWDGRFVITANHDTTVMTRYARQGGSKAGLSTYDLSQAVCETGGCDIECLVASRLQKMLMTSAELMV
ncbi:MAG: tRNA lysidine(34) synthetase TilS [Hyphomonadaceae bacterium]|nr:tRNA lysidine(34) synthetase TilS [Hyphomonadaceae bacterium]MBC6412469.1 tRNA lysidine(34) synthetase TilS [Hyphomonadaceae bacterium]